MENNNLTVILAAILVILLCYRFSQTRKVVIIEPREQFDPVVLDPVTGEKDSKCGVQFNMQGNRYLVTPESQKGKPCSCGRLCDCEAHSGFDSHWRTEYEPGANNTTQDLIWNKTSPRMTLVDNNIRWDAYGPDSQYDAPPGLPSDSTTDSRYLNRLNVDHNSSPYESECKSCDLKYQMSPPISTGIRQQPEDDLSRLVQESLSKAR